MKPKIGILTFSDGREYAHNALLEMNQRFLDRVVSEIKRTGEVELVVGDEIINTPSKAREEAKKIVARDVDGTIFNFSIWCFPHLAVIAAQNGKPPYLLLSNLNPQYAGLVGMMASAGSLDQLGIKNTRVWGDIKDPTVLNKVFSFSRVCKVVSRLKEQTCGLIGGRSMGMYTGVVDTRQWQKEFGVDIEHIDQLEIIRLASEIPENKVVAGFKWLTENVGKILYDGKGLTEEKLRYQLRCYYATKEIIRRCGLDFIGIKCQTELTDNYVSQCLTQAFLNDPYDMDGKKEPFVCACECDMDGALTMQILKLLTGYPVLFFDFRHYDKNEDVFVFSNCGSQATWYADRSENPKDNLRKVSFCPQTPTFYAAGGATVRYMCKRGPVTLARLMRKNGKYWMAIMSGEFVEYPEEKMKETSNEWPQGFVKLRVNPSELISEYGSNHAHAVFGSWVEDLVQISDVLNIEYKVYG